MKFITLGLIILFNFAFVDSYAAISRSELVTYNLNFYERKQKNIAVQEKLIEEKRRIQEEKDKAAKDGWFKKKEKVKKLLDNLLFTIETTTTHDDNRFKSNTRQTKELSHASTLAVSYIPKTSFDKKQKTDFFFDYDGDGLKFGKAGSSNTNSSNIRLGVNHRLTDKYAFLLDYKRSISEATASAVTGSGTSNKLTGTTTHIFGGKFNAEWGRFPWEIEYFHEESLHKKEFETSDSVIDTLNLAGYFRLSGKTDLLWEYGIEETEHPHQITNNFNVNSYKFGIRGKLASKLNGIAKFGWGVYDFDSGSEQDSEEISVNLNYRPLKRLMLGLTSNRKVNVGAASTASSSKSNGLGVKCKYLPPFNKKITLSVSTQATNTDFSESNRSDEKLSFTIGADYGLNKWTKLGLEYSRETNESTDQDKEYTQNKVALTGTFEF